MSLPENSSVIQELIRNKPYESATLTALTAHVTSQTQTGTYDFDANKALMKIYQCYPDLANADVIANTLVLSMMRLPRNDLLMLSYLVPPKVISSSPKIALVQKCTEEMEAARFADFWAVLASSPVAAETFQAAGFREAIRNVITEIVQATFRTITASMLQDMLGFSSSSELSSFCASSSLVQEIKDGIVLMKPCVETQPRLQHFEEGLRFEDAMKLVLSMRKFEV